jgi:hypothetical protein
MADEIPPVEDCEDSDDTCCVVVKKCSTVKEAIPVCAATEEATHPSDGCTKLDKTFDKSIDAVIIPSVGSETQINLCDSSLYTVGSWIEFVDGPFAGTKLQVTTVNAVNGYIKARNSCSDGITAISDNASPGATLAAESRFIVTGSPKCESSADKISELESLLPLVEDICLDEIANKAITEELKLLGVAVANECVEGEVQPCVRKSETRELKDGSLKLGNIDENQEIIDPTTFPAHVNSQNVLVKGAEADTTSKWLFTTETTIASHNSDPGGEQIYTLPAGKPANANHAIIQVHLYVDDNPAGNIMVGFTNVRPIRSINSWGEAYTVVNISVPIESNQIKYLLSATDGGAMDFSGSTKVDLFLLGYEKTTTIA